MSDNYTWLEEVKNKILEDNLEVVDYASKLLHDKFPYPADSYTNPTTIDSNITNELTTIDKDKNLPTKKVLHFTGNTDMNICKACGVSRFSKSNDVWVVLSSTWNLDDPMYERCSSLKWDPREQDINFISPVLKGSLVPLGSVRGRLISILNNSLFRSKYSALACKMLNMLEERPAAILYEEFKTLLSLHGNKTLIVDGTTPGTLLLEILKDCYVFS